MKILSYLASFKVRNKRKIEKAVHIKNLGEMPLNGKQGNLMIANNPRINMMEYIKNIRTNIFNSTNKKILSIISYNQGEGKSFVANNLAVSMARVNKRILLIDANLRKESEKSETFYAESGEGLSDFIRNVELNNKLDNLNKCKKYIKKTQIPNLYILPSGTITSNSAELLKSKKINELLNLVKELFDYVLIDGTSFFENSDCINIAKIADSNIIIAEKNKTRYLDLYKLKEELEDNNCEILGFILNKSKVKNKKSKKQSRKQNIGIYMETTREEINNEIPLENTIDKIIHEIKSEDINDFEVLHKEIKDNIMIEDFINDIETNFNIKFDNIEKENRENNEIFLQKIDEIKSTINDEVYKYTYNRSKEFKLYERLYKKIIRRQKKLEDEIIDIKLNHEKNLNYFEQIIDEINNKNYDEKIENLSQKIEALEKNNDKKKIDEDKILNVDVNNSQNNNENENDELKEVNERKKSNIINFKKIFMQNRKKSTFSINETITYEDLERLAVDVVYFNDGEDLNIDKIAKKI